MSEAVLISRIKEMKCGSKTIPQEYIDCFNDYIEKVINIRVDEEIAGKFELEKFKSVNDLMCAYKNLEKVFTKSRQKIADLEAKLDEKTRVAEGYSELFDKKQHENYEQFCEIQELKQQLADMQNEKDKIEEENQNLTQCIEELKEENELIKKNLIEECKEHQEFCKVADEKVKELKQQLKEAEKEIAIWERAYEYAIFELDFYKNHTQTTTEETMKRIEQLYEKILKRAKLLMGNK